MSLKSAKNTCTTTWVRKKMLFSDKVYSFLHFNKTLLLMIRGFAQLFHGTECLVESHSLQYKTEMKISSLSKHSVSPLLFSCEAASSCSGTFLLVKSFLFYSKSTDAIGQLEIYRASGISLTEPFLKCLSFSSIIPQC